MKEHAKVSTVVSKSYIRTTKPAEQIRVEPSVAMIKDLLVDSMYGHVIYFYDEAPRIAKPDKKDKHRPVVGMHVVSVNIGDRCYHGLCDLGASVSDIPFSLYEEIKNEIAHAEIEYIVVTIKLANRDTISPLGFLEMLKSCVGKYNTLIIFLFLAPHKMTFVPLSLVDLS